MTDQYRYYLADHSETTPEQVSAVLGVPVPRVRELIAAGLPVKDVMVRRVFVGEVQPVATVRPAPKAKPVPIAVVIPPDYRSAFKAEMERLAPGLTRATVRECAGCGYEWQDRKCPKCGGHVAEVVERVGGYKKVRR